MTTVCTRKFLIELGRNLKQLPLHASQKPEHSISCITVALSGLLSSLEVSRIYEMFKNHLRPNRSDGPVVERLPHNR